MWPHLGAGCWVRGLEPCRAVGLCRGMSQRQAGCTCWVSPATCGPRFLLCLGLPATSSLMGAVPKLCCVPPRDGGESL